MTEQQYLAFDRAAEFRHEFLDGEIVPRLGANILHATVQMDLICELHASLRGTACEVFGSDLRVRVSPLIYTYPDLTVVCGKALVADEHEDILLNPAVIFEIVSPSTEFYDRGVKFRRYREVESLQDYILVGQDQFRIEQYTRGGANTWTLHDYQRPGDLLQIASIGISLTLAAIYERIEFPAE